MLSRKNVDFASGIFFIAAAAGIYSEASQMPKYGDGIGSGGYPIFVAAGMFILGAILAASSLLQIIAKVEGEEKKITGFGRVLIFLGMIVVYIFAMDYLGFNLTSFIFMVAASMFFGYEKGWVRVIVISAILTVASYITFRYGFLVLLPTGRIF